MVILDILYYFYRDGNRQSILFFSFVLQGIFEDTMYRLQASGLNTKLVVDIFKAPAKIPLPLVRVNQEWNLSSFKP
jgi:hypothetical protein